VSFSEPPPRFIFSHFLQSSMAEDAPLRARATHVKTLYIRLFRWMSFFCFPHPQRFPFESSLPPSLCPSAGFGPGPLSILVDPLLLGCFPLLELTPLPFSYPCCPVTLSKPFPAPRLRFFPFPLRLVAHLVRTRFSFAVLLGSDTPLREACEEQGQMVPLFFFLGFRSNGLTPVSKTS